MKAKLNNLIHDLIIGRDAPPGAFKNKQIADFFNRAHALMSHVPHLRFDEDEHSEDGKIIRSVFFNSISIPAIIRVVIHSKGDDHQFVTLDYDFLEDFS